jgi:large subunit ribosomal protein L29
MNARELRGKSDGELRSELVDLHREAFNLRMQKGMGQLSRPSQVRRLRRDIARLKTILSERRVPK